MKGPAGPTETQLVHLGKFDMKLNPFKFIKETTRFCNEIKQKLKAGIEDLCKCP